MTSFRCKVSNVMFTLQLWIVVDFASTELND